MPPKVRKIVEEIAAAHKVTMHDLFVAKRRCRPHAMARRDMAVALYRPGDDIRHTNGSTFKPGSVSQVARYVGLSHATVLYHLWRAGVKSSPKYDRSKVHGKKADVAISNPVT